EGSASSSVRFLLTVVETPPASAAGPQKSTLVLVLLAFLSSLRHFCPFRRVSLTRRLEPCGDCFGLCSAPPWAAPATALAFLSRLTTAVGAVRRHLAFFDLLTHGR